MQEENKEMEKCIQKAVAEALGEEKRQRKVRILHNTRILMESYIEMQNYIERAISESEELNERAISVYYSVFGNDSEHLDSIRRSRMKTALMMANIDRALEELRREQQENGTLYKYEAFRMHYVEGKTFEEVADIMNCGKNTPSRWSKEMIRKMSVKLFGVDGIEKW